jgi:membrane fusion protein, multidrug efflux system
MNSRRWVAPTLLLAGLGLVGGSLAAWKSSSIARADTASANQPEPTESVTVAVARKREHQPTTSAIGTVIALRSITLRNELPGTVRQVRLTPGQIVEAGTVLVALDVSVESADLKALQAQAALAETTLARVQRMVQSRAVSEMELDNAKAQRDVALAQVARMQAVIARKIIRAPFRARVGIADVHPGQYLNEGTQLTTLQGVDDSAYVDFAVPQHVAATLSTDDSVSVYEAGDQEYTSAKIVAIDSRVDPSTRNAIVRARIEDALHAPAPGASVRVGVPTGPARMAVLVPVSALRKGPGSDHVFVIESTKDGKLRARQREVIAGSVLGDEVVIEKGLTAGEQIAAAGSFKLREAVLVVANDGNRARTGG